MRKFYSITKVTVKLAKSYDVEGQYHLYLEAYPVFTPGCDKPQRVSKRINRQILTPIWDKNRPTRNGNYLPKRDINGIIQCTSSVDKDACFLAECLRKQMQDEYEHAAIFTEEEAKLMHQRELDNTDFIEYFNRIRKERHKNDSDSIRVNWKRVGELLTIFAEGKPLLMKNINVHMMERMKSKFLTAPQGGNKTGTLSRNSASTYFAIFKAGVHQAFVDEYLTVDIAAKVKGIPEEERRREYVTIEEMQRLVETECSNPVLKRAAIFSFLTGLRHCDIQKLKWNEVILIDGQWQLHFTQRKTKGVEYLPISEEARVVCGEYTDANLLVFDGLKNTPYNTKAFDDWIKAAGIDRHITFHCMRHSYATNQLASGTDIYTICNLLGHRKVETTQRYTKVVDEKKIQAANSIKIDVSKL